ncbi:hypothetical protein EVAR_81563_1 [Eumeta japonica]|uniref:Uncharacterized protein n=1 Tax=Eumeta variegata TaxID=151549 RepID=A0A4C1V0M5_EUMVA|nr:hypothetical protein EVAR_81563_1 [Eumeta japonica]
MMFSVCKSSGGPHSTTSPHFLIHRAPFPLHQPTPPSITYLTPIQEASNALMTPLGLRVFMGGGVHLLNLLFGYVRLPPDLL